MVSATSQAAPERVVFTRVQAAQFFGISTRTLDAWTAKGWLQSVRFGRCVRYHRDELERVAREGIRS